MAYPNYAGQNMYYPQFQGNIYNPHPSYFANAMQQNYNPQPQQQVQQAQNQQRESITTQPPIMQPQINSISKIIPVLTKEEATGSPVDLVNGTPSFFYNKSNGEIYFKQFDVPNGLAIFKTYLEVKEPEKVVLMAIEFLSDDDYPFSEPSERAYKWVECHIKKQKKELEKEFKY